MKDALRGVQSPDSIWRFGDLLAVYSETLYKLPKDVRDLPPFSLADLEDVFLACYDGLELYNTRRFSLEGAILSNLLHFYTSAKDREQFDDLFLNPLLKFYDEHPNFRPRTTPSTEDRVFWAVSMIWCGMNYEEAYSHVTPQYAGSIDSFRPLMRRTFIHISQANESLVSFPTMTEWQNHNVGKGMERFPKKLFLFIDGTSWPLLMPGCHLLRRVLYVA